MGTQHKDLLARTRAQLAAERGVHASLRALPTHTRMALTIGALAVVTVLVGLFSRRTDFDAYPVALMAASLGALAVVSVLACGRLLRPAHRRAAPIARTMMIAFVGIVLPAVLALLPEAHDLVHEHPESFLGTGADFWPRARTCFFFGLVSALPVYALTLVFDRLSWRTVPAMLLAATAAGATANIALLLHCPLVSSSHMLTGHATVPLAFALPAVFLLLVRRK
ncbi:MAG: hypothetical protein ACYTGZ_12725 [Planctomycetota bacterium]|jgi:hypothetical protein